MEGTCNRCAFPIQKNYFSGTTPLMHAALKGYIQCVKELITAGADVNRYNEKGQTALIYAAFKGYVECVKELIAAGANVNQADNNGNTPVMWTAFDRQTACLVELIKSGADVNISNRDGRTVLMEQAANGSEEYISVLVNAGADVNMVDVNNAIALLYAACNGKDKCLADLLTTSNTNHTNSDGYTALLLACRKGFPKCADLLLKAGADVNIKTRCKSTPLTVAATWDHPKCLQLLIDAGADVNIQTEDKSTALMEAATWDHLECVKLLLTAGAHVNFATPESSALHLAAANANHRCVDALLSAGADVNKTTKPILVAALAHTIKQCRMAFEEMKETYILENHSHSTCVKLLIGAGADVNMANNKGFTPLINAAMNDHDDCIDLLVQEGASVNQAAVHSITPIIAAAIDWTPKCLQKLISVGADVNTVRYGDGGRIALMECVWMPQEKYKGDGRSHMRYIEEKCNQKECVEIFINAGANVNARTDDGITTLMKASGHGYEECVKLLLEAGADVNAAYRDGCTSLIYAAMFGHETCIDHLLAAGANVNDYCKRRGTPLIYSAMYGHDACLGPLIAAGADLNRKDKKGLTALMHAAWFGNFKCVGTLLQAGADVNLKESKWGSTAFILASSYDKHSCVSLCDRYNFTIRRYSAFVPQDHSASRCVEALRKAGADVNVVDSRGRTALIRAAQIGGNILVIKRLLKANCRINMVGRPWGHSALTSHILYGRRQPNDISMLLFAAGEMVDDFEKQRLQNILKLEDPGIQLKHICREVIRKHLLELDPHQHLFERIPMLGLPSALSRYLLYGESLDDDNGDNHDDGKKSSDNK